MSPDPALAIGPTYRVGVVEPHAFYRTSIATQSAALTCRATQVSQAVYDAQRNRTYITYTAGLDGVDAQNRPFTAQNPFIMAFDHTSKTWAGPVEIGDVNAPNRDCHDYPQILIDSQGYLHVFYTFHGNGRNIMHFKSRAPHDIAGPWPPPSEIPETGGNTYGAAHKNNQGHFYVFYRDTVWRRNATATQTELWYEPQRYVKSTDEGRTWSQPRMLIDPGRPSASDADPAARAATSLINDSGWNTIYVANWLRDPARNRLVIDFTATAIHAQQWGNRIIFFFDMNDDSVRTMKGTVLGSRIDRPAYLGNQAEGIRVFNERYVLAHLTKYGRAASQSIVIEDEARGHPTVYYVRFESGNPAAGPDHEDYYKTGWDRLRRARWTGDRWDDNYVSGIADPGADPFIQWDDITQRRRETSHIFATEYRGADGTFLYTKTRWGGKRFWLKPDGTRNPEFAWNNPAYDYQFPSRVFNTRWPFTTQVRMFNDQHDLERRGISNFTLVPGGHKQIRALMRMPKYDWLTPTTGAQAQTDQYAIGEDFVWGEDPPQPL